MEEILDYFQSAVMDSEAFQQIQQVTTTALQYAKFLGILVFGVLLISSLGHFLLGKKAQFHIAVSSAMEILVVYILYAVVLSLELQFQQFFAPLPFVTMAEDYLLFLPVLSADLPLICQHVLDLLIIAFLVNLISGIMPSGRNVFIWLFLRLITVAASIALLYAVDLLLQHYLPQGFDAYAPTILLVCLCALVLLGSLKLLTGAALAFLDPIVAALYTFFFANIIGRALARAMVTTALLTGLVAALDALQIRSVHVAPDVLQGYIPLLAVVLVLWYLVGHIFHKKT